MQSGARVLCRFAKAYQLGVVSNTTSSMVNVKLDSNAEQAFRLDRLSNVRTWKLSAGLLTPKRLEQVKEKALPDDFDWLGLFRSAKLPTAYDESLYRAMWYFANTAAFNSELELPTFNTKPGTKNAGLFTFKAGKNGRDIISMSKKLLSYKNVFTIMAHEMVHQYNYNIDYAKNRTFDPRIGVHGETFLKWIPIIKSKLGITISVFDDVGHRDAEIDETYIKETKAIANPVAVLTFKTKTGGTYAATYKSSADLMKAARRLSAIYKSQGIIHTIWLADKNLLTQLKTGQSDRAASGTFIIEEGIRLAPISEKIYFAILALGKPVDE